jgi:hypothetical protein
MAQISSSRHRWSADLRREFRLDPPLTIAELGIDMRESTLGRVYAAEFKARLQDAGLRAFCNPQRRAPEWRSESVTTISDPDDASQVVVEECEP